MAQDARKIALSLLNKLDKGGVTVDRLLDQIDDRHPSIPRRDRSLLNNLVYGVLRWRGRLDWIIASFSKTPLEKIDSRVINLLRLGVFQIVFLDRVPDSAAVNTTVQMSKAFAPSWVVGYINGLLRRISREHHNVFFPLTDEDPLRALTAQKSFPEWLIRRWLDRFGLERTESLCDAINTIPPITLRTNTLRVTREKLRGSLVADVDTMQLTDHSPDGIRCTTPRISLGEMSAFKAGWFHVQDEAAQLVSILLDPQPGDTVLDACAGRGGKTGHIAQIMGDRGRIVAMDNDRGRLSQLTEEMNRLGVSIVETACNDLTDPHLPAATAGFDRILLDAPCSGLGVLRRNPDTKWSVGEADLMRLSDHQRSLLHNLAPFVKPSGILNYTVCSMEPEETDDVVDRFLSKERRFSVDKPLPGSTSNIAGLIDPDGFLRTAPDLHDMAGFFSVNFRRMS
ncbi:MAG: 16S rRNA (cytosine(967)-C(5))-methyltransferase RsmB [Desulfobacterales bacterium]